MITVTAGPTGGIHSFGTHNFFDGVDVGNLTITGEFNTGVGFNAPQTTTSGWCNTATVALALRADTDRFANTAARLFDGEHSD